MAFKVNQFLANLFQSSSEPEPKKHTPAAPLQLPDLKKPNPTPEPFQTWPERSHMHPLRLMKSKPVVQPQPEWAPSLDEICAKQEPNALVQALHEQAAWFYSYETQGECDIPEAFADFPALSRPNVQILVRALASHKGYQRLSLQVCGKPKLLKAEETIQLQIQALQGQMVMIVDMSAGQWHGDTLLIPPFQEVIISYQLFGQASEPNALYVDLKRPALGLPPVKMALVHACQTGASESSIASFV